MYHVVQSRWIRGSDQSGEHIVWSGTQKREANGQARHIFKSHLDMLVRHNMVTDDFDLDEEALSVTLADDEGLWYYSRFRMIEIKGLKEA